MIAPVIAFDLDGTLVDTAPDLVTTLNVIFDRLDLPPVDYTTARNMVGGGARKMIEQGLAAEGRVIAVEEVDELTRQFIEYYAEHIADRSRPFPGVESALPELASRGCRLAVCTNKLEWLAVRLLDKLGLLQHFVAISGGDTFKLQKPRPEPLRGTIARAGGAERRAIMVGDSITDIATGHAAGIPVIAVDYGYSKIPVAELGAARVISAFSELPRVVFELLDARLEPPK
ncbi:MAG: HAD family hydrolase [Xanthobacteraceae bacterium]|jgi:phosphoglycolate phosphatase